MSKSMPLEAAREAKNQRAASTPISLSSSSRVMNSPVRLDIGTSLPSRTKRTQAVRIIWTWSRSNPGDVAVVVLAPDEDDALVAAAELLDEVADVGREVGGRRVVCRAQDDSILVVAEFGRSEDDRAVLLVHVASDAQSIDRLLDPAA